MPRGARSSASSRSCAASVAELAPVEGRPAQRRATSLVVDLVDESGEGQRDSSSSSAPAGSSRRSSARSSAMSAGETKSVEYELADEREQHGRGRRSRRSRRRCCRRSTTSWRARRASSTRSPSCAPTSRTRLARAARGRARRRSSARPPSTRSSRRRTSTSAGRARRGARRRAAERASRRSLERRGIDAEPYFQLSPARPPTSSSSGCAPRRARSVARELVLEAVADKLGIEVSDEEIEELVREQAERGRRGSPRLIEQLCAGRPPGALREDLRLRKALDRIAAEVKRDPGRARARAREHLDAREGKTRDRCEIVDPRRSKEPA